MKFVANLRARSIETFKWRWQPEAWLLSVHRLTPSTKKHAIQLRRKGVALFADNGVKQYIDRILKEFDQEADLILQEVAQVRRQLGHIPHGKEVPTNLRQRAATLANKVEAACLQYSSDDWQHILQAQLSMQPSHIISLEDFVVTCLIGLNLERELTGWSLERIDRCNRRSIALWKHYQQDPRTKEHTVYTTLSAMDYNSAVHAGRLAARSGIEHVALGVASITRDQHAVDFIIHGRALSRLTKPVLRRYLRFTQIIRGLVDGYRSVGKYMRSFHALGLGAGNFFPLLAAVMDPRTVVTADATSPIHDAVRDKVMYEPGGGNKRVSTRAAVARIVRDEPWSFACPFCRSFRRRYGHDARSARRWWLTQGCPKIQKHHLARGSELAKEIPLFTRSDSDTEREARYVHVAHNHYVLSQALAAYPQGNKRQLKGQKELEHLISALGSTVITNALTASKNWVLSRAVPKSYITTEN